MGSTVMYEVIPRISSGNAGHFRFSEHFIREPKNSKYDATLILGARLDHDHFTPNQDVVNSYIWTGFTKKSKLIDRMYIEDIYVSSGQPSSLEDEYTEIQAGVGYSDEGPDSMVDLATEGTIGWLWTRNFLSAQGLKVGKMSVDGCFDCEDVQNFVWMEWLSPKHYHYNLLPSDLMLVFHHMSQNYGNTYAKEAYALFKIIAKVNFLRGEKSSELAE